ncbi:MAG TPA: hypothetical protein VFM39_06880 [bacterium]|nr:hypothetical protein [bacterium]
MKTIAAVVVLSALVLLLGPVAFGNGRALFVEQSRHVPAICMDWSPVMMEGVDEFRHIRDDIECRPSEMIFGRNFEE